MEDNFLGISANFWLAIVGGIYAFATLLLAWWTNAASRRSDRTAHIIAGDQIVATRAAITAQIEAAEVAQNKQLSVMREAAIIQARASSVSNNRQAWINSLRDEVSGFLTDRDMLDIVVNRTPDFDPNREDKILPLEKALIAHVYKVRLLINPTEGESVDLINMLEEVRYKGLNGGMREKIVHHTQSILKTEWERVKSGA